MKRKTKRSAASQYQTMTSNELQSLRVKSLVNPLGCVLALWVPSSLIQSGLDVMKAWGFKHKQTLVWVKTKNVPLKKLMDEVINQDKTGGLYVPSINWAMHKFDLSDVLSFGMGRLFRQSHEIALIGTCGKSIYKSLNNRGQRSVIFGPAGRHSTKPDELQDRLETMFPLANKCEIFARRNKFNWTCIGDGVTGKDVAQSIVELNAL